jgi:hypothetical protein
MKSIKFVTLFILITGLLVFSLIACSWDSGNNNSIKSTPKPGYDLAGYQTATYGAKQFHLQLTAIAENQGENFEERSNSMDFGSTGQSLLMGGAAGP